MGGVFRTNRIDGNPIKVFAASHSDYTGCKWVAVRTYHAPRRREPPFSMNDYGANFVIRFVACEINYLPGRERLQTTRGRRSSSCGSNNSNGGRCQPARRTGDNILIRLSTRPLERTNGLGRHPTCKSKQQQERQHQQQQEERPAGRGISVMSFNLIQLPTY